MLIRNEKRDVAIGKHVFWGQMPLPRGASIDGVVEVGKERKGALIKLKNGVYVQGNTGGFRLLHQGEVREAME